MIQDHDFPSLVPGNPGSSLGSGGLTLALFDTLEFQILVQGAVESFEDRRSGGGCFPSGHK